MIPIYESIYTKKGDVGIYPSADGNTFNIGKFNKGKRENEAGEVLTGSSLTEYRKYAQKDKKNPKFFEQVEIFSPEGFKSRKDFLDNGITKYQNSEYDFSVIKSQPVMVKDQNGNLVAKTSMKKIPDPNDSSKTIYSMQPVTEKVVSLDVDNLKEFRKTDEGRGFLLSSIGDKNPKSVYAGMGYDPVTFTEDLFLDALTQNLIETYNK